MSDGLNRAMLLGGLGSDPELKYTQGGTAVLSMRLATDSSFKGKDGNWQKQTEWHSVKLFGPRAEALNKLLAKGKKVYVEGRIQTRSWEDKKTGDKRFATEIVADNVILCSDAPRGQRDERARQQPDEDFDNGADVF